MKVSKRKLEQEQSHARILTLMDMFAKTIKAHYQSGGSYPEVLDALRTIERYVVDKDKMAHAKASMEGRR